MRRKKLVSPEKPVQDSIEYRFKQLLLPNISYALAVTILGGFSFGIFAAINTKSIAEAIITVIGFLSFSLIAGAFGIWYTVKELDIVMNSENISAVDYWHRRKCIGWKEITLIKQVQLFGIRYLSIKIANGRSVQVASHFYNSSELLDRVRELAGEDHILVRALEKELSRPRYELTKLWAGVIGAIALTMSIYLIGGNIYAAEQEKPIEQAIATYVRQHPKTAPNQSAIELQALMTKLGLSVEVFGDGSEVKVRPEKAAIAEWTAIERSLHDFVNKQLDRTEDSIEPIPNKLATYLKNHQADLKAIATHLANNPLPEWGNDSWISQSNPSAENSPLFSKTPNFFSTTNLESLAIANLIDKQQQPTTDLSKDLIILEKIQQSIYSQQSLVAQLHNLIGEGRISRLVRQIDSRQAALNKRLPQGWGNNLFVKERHEYMIGTIQNESITANKFLQNPALFDRLLVAYDIPLRWIPGLSYLMSPHLRLAAVDRYREITKGLAYWHKQNICLTDGNSGIKSRLSLAEYTIDPALLISQYPKVLKRDLLWELTTSVRQVKAKLAAGQNVDLVARDFKLQSQVCPGEQWTAKATDGAVNIEFSHPPDWQALGLSNSNQSESLTYKIKSVDR